MATQNSTRLNTHGDTFEPYGGVSYSVVMFKTQHGCLFTLNYCCQSMCLVWSSLLSDIKQQHFLPVDLL